MNTLKNNVFIFIVSFIFCLGAEAQDLLVKKDGSVLQIKTEEISETTIKYRLWDDQSGPLRSISIESVLSINYANGRIEKFNSNATPNAAEQPVQVVPQATAPSQITNETIKPTSVTVPRGTIIPIYSDMTFRPKDVGSFKPKELCLAVVKDDVVIDGITALHKGTEVYGKLNIVNKFFQMANGFKLLYILTTEGSVIPIEGFLLLAPSGKSLRVKESDSICTVKEDVTISLTD